jgi:hypothetical protein
VKSETIFIACPNGHNIPAKKIDGEESLLALQQFVCPTCQHQWQLRIPFRVIAIRLPIPLS